MIKNQCISVNNLIRQSKGNIVSNMNGEKVMLSVANGKYYNLGKLGGQIWDLIEEPKTIYQLVSQLMSEYDVDILKCEEQVISFLDQLLEQELIEINS
jgi:hypothetical protein